MASYSEQRKNESKQSLLRGQRRETSESQSSRTFKVFLTVIASLIALFVLLMAIEVLENRNNSIITLNGILPTAEALVFNERVYSGDGFNAGMSTDCDRTCTAGDTRTCLYQWTVTYYYSMLTGPNRPCGDCPFNESDCSNRDCVTLNGVSRALVAVNRQVPGPSIIACTGDRIVVDVNNELEDMTGITFHWHGVRQIGSPAMDGPSMITQCPIPFATSFRYAFNADSPGTYFWHSHIGSNRADGLAGAMIIRDIEDEHSSLYDVDSNEHVLLLQDWMNITQNSNYIKYIFDVGDNTPDFLLINAKGKGPPFYRGTREATFVPRHVLHVTNLKRYRIRVISNGFTGCPLQVSVDSHSLLMVATDGCHIVPKSCDAFLIHSGERIDLILEANQTIDNYWIRVVGLGPACGGFQELAILRYEGAPTADPSLPERPSPSPNVVSNVPVNPSTYYPQTIYLTDLRSTDPYDIFVGSESTYYLPLGFFTPSTNDTALRGDRPQINHITFTFPPVPLLTQHGEVDNSLFCDARDVHGWTHCVTSQCSCTQKISVELNETMELFLYNQVDETSCHPMHLHGYSVRIVGMGKMNDSHLAPWEVRELDMKGHFPRLDTKYPLKKDTFCIAYMSYMIVQFVADNPGWWFLHCHADFHNLLGMAMVLNVGTDDDITPFIPDDFPRCENFHV